MYIVKSLALKTFDDRKQNVMSTIKMPRIVVL